MLQDLGIVENDSEVEKEMSATRPALAQLQNGQLKSGRVAKPHDTVKTLVIWPQQRLGVRYMRGKKLNFHNLDLRLLIAGKIKVITSGEITEIEQNCRLNLMNKILYFTQLFCQKLKWGLSPGIKIFAG